MRAVPDPDAPPPADEEPGALPPYDSDAESALLGSMMLSAAARQTAMDMLDAGDFYVPKHAAIFRAMRQLNEREKPADALLLTGLLKGQVSQREILAVQAATPASANAPHYAELVAEASAARRAIAYSSELHDAAMARDGEKIAALAHDAPHRLESPVTVVEPGIDVSDFIDSAPPPSAADWAVRDVLRRGEVLLLTGPEGQGKTTFMRQMAFQTAIGDHPFQRTTEPKRSVLYVDLQDPDDQIRAEFAKFRNGPGQRYDRGSGLLSVKSRQAGIDLTTARDVRWLDGLIAHHQPDLVCLGPLYRAFRGTDRADKNSEEAADRVTDALTRLMTRHNFALILEGHSPHDGEKDNWRPRGSRLWIGWPTFGFGLAPTKRKATAADDPEAEDPEAEKEKTVAGGKKRQRYRFVAWRGLRDRERAWPEALMAVGFSAGGWPWVPPERDPSTRDTSQGVQDTLASKDPF